VVNKRGEEVYELGVQPNLLFDFNAEPYGFNKRPEESTLEYIQRVRKLDSLYKRDADFSLVDMMPGNQKHFNSHLITFDNTFYFSISTALRGNRKTKAKEILREPKKLTDRALGFDLDVDLHITFNQSHRKAERKVEPISYINRVCAYVKLSTNFLSFFTSNMYQNYHDFLPPASHLDNLKVDSNSLFAIDYANKDWTHDHDSILTRRSQEFPRFAGNFKSKLAKDKPWGLKSDPVYFDCQADLTQLPGEHFERGVWYYSGLTQVDHCDLCGFDNALQPIRSFLGVEFRPQFWANLFQRLRTLDVGEPKSLEKC